MRSETDASGMNCCGPNIRSRRKALGLTRDELVDLVSPFVPLTVRTLQRIENRESPVNDLMLFYLSQALNTTTDDLVGIS